MQYAAEKSRTGRPALLLLIRLTSGFFYSQQRPHGRCPLAAASVYVSRPIRSSGRTARTGGGNSIRRSKRRRSRACRSRCSNSNCSRSSHSNRYRRHSRCPGRHNRSPARSRFSDCRRPAFGSSILCGNRCDRYTGSSAPLRQARRSRSSPACPATARRSTSFRRTGCNTVKT